MLLYAVGVQALSLYEYKTIVLHIIQPRSKDGQPSSRWEISADELAKFETESRGKFLATLDPKAPRVPGETQCKWCQAKPFCPEFMNKGLAVARTTFADFTTTKIRKGDNPPPLIGITWTAQTLRQAWDNLWILSDIAEVIKSSVLLALKKGGGELLGLKLVRGKSNRRWKDELEAMQYIARSAGRDLKPGAYAPRRMIGITEMEKLLAGMKMDKKARDKFLSPVVVKPPGAPTITPITDPRPAINAAAEDFKDI
jgi:hypothetical protein